MGYMTYYTLSVKRRGEDLEEDDLKELSDTLEVLNIIDYALEEGFLIHDSRLKTQIAFFNSCDGVTWYNYDEDMCKVSAMYPEFVFKLSGFGESLGDVWDSYYEKGISERCPYVPTTPKKIAW